MSEKPNAGTKQNAPVRLAVTFAWMLCSVNPSEVSVEHQGWKKKCLKCLKFIYGKRDREVEVPNAKAIRRLTPWGKKKQQASVSRSQLWPLSLTTVLHLRLAGAFIQPGEIKQHIC